MAHYRIVLAAAACAVLGACASVAPRDGEAAAAARGGLPSTPTDWAAVSASLGEVELGWVENLDDTVLESLIREGVANNQNLEAAEANVARSWALARQAGAALSPNVALSGGGSGSGVADGGSSGSINVGVQASWELDVWGRIRSGRQAAVSSAEAAQADYEFAQQSLAAGIARSYFLAIEANRQADIAQSLVDTLGETQRIVGVQFDNGLATAQDVALVRSDAATAQDSLVTSQGAQRDAARALELLLGRYPSAELDVGRALPATPAPPPPGIPSDILERRPDLIAAERRIAASISNVDQAKAARLPSISLTGSVGGASDALSNLLNPTNVAWQAASSLLVPIVDGGARQAQVDVSRADERAAVASYVDAALQAFAEVETSLDQGGVLRERRVALDTAATEAAEALRIAQLRFDAGESDLLDVLTIQQRVFSAQSSLLSVERLQLDQYVDLNLALGGEWE